MQYLGIFQGCFERALLEEDTPYVTSLVRYTQLKQRHIGIYPIGFPNHVGRQASDLLIRLQLPLVTIPKWRRTKGSLE